MNSKAAKVVQELYRPVIRVYLIVAASYYGVMSITHFAYFSGADLLVMAGVSILATIVGVFGAFELRKRISVRRVEAVSR